MDDHNNQLANLKDEITEASKNHTRLVYKQEDLREVLQTLREEVAAAEAKYEQVRAEAEARAEDRTNKVEEEIKSLEAEVERLAQEERRFLANQESFAERGVPTEPIIPAEVLARQCQNLRTEQKSFEDEAAEWRDKAKALDIVQPELCSELTEAREKTAKSELDAARLQAELIRLEDEEEGDLVHLPMRSPSRKARLSPCLSPSKQQGGVSEQEAWRIEAEARASKLRVDELARELEEALEQSCKRQRKGLADAELRARRLLARNTLSADLAAELGRDVKPADEITALAAGIRAQQASRPNLSLRESPGQTLRRRIEETPRPRPPAQNARNPSASSSFSFESPEHQASNLVEDNAKLRAEVQALHVSLFINGSQQEEVENLDFDYRSPLLAEPQLETALSHSRTRLRAMLREQLEDSRKLMASLHHDIAASEKSLQRERKMRDELSQRLQRIETSAQSTSDVTPTKFRSAGAACSPEPLPPNLSMLSSAVSESGNVALNDDISDVDHSTVHSSATGSPLSYGGGWVL